MGPEEIVGWSSSEIMSGDQKSFVRLCKIPINVRYHALIVELQIVGGTSRVMVAPLHYNRGSL